MFFQEEYAGKDCVKHFYDRLAFYSDVVRDRKWKNRQMSKIIASPSEWCAFYKAKDCYICGAPFQKSKNQRKVVDHDHVSGKMLGAAHSLCNFKRQGPYHTPIFFHNAQG